MWFLREGITLDAAMMTILTLLIIIFVVIPIHEWAHGFVAYKLGDNTAKYNGRLTLNPLKHIDPLGAMFMILFRIGWAKPVPVDARNFKNPKLGMALTALAGPMVNIILAFFSAVGFTSLVCFGMNVQDYAIRSILDYTETFLLIFSEVNVGLAVFNFLPLPPLDGSKILGAFLPDRILYKYYQYERYIILIVFFLLVTNVLSGPLNFIGNFVLKMIFNLSYKLVSIFFIV